MEKLKLVLKKVLLEGASQATFRIGEPVKITVQKVRVVPVPEFGLVDQAWIDGLYKTLFPREGLALLSEQLVRSQFNIVNVGKVNAIADPRPPKTLYLFFPPNGDVISQDVWVSISPAAKEAAPPPPPPPLQIPVPPPVEAATTISTAPPVTAGASTISGAIKAEASNTQQAPARDVTQMWQMVDATSSLQAPVIIPDEVQANKAHLALLVSSDAPIVAKLKASLEAMKLYAYASDNDSIVFNILDRVMPKFVVLDEKNPKFEIILKKIYDMEMSKRSQVTVLMLSKSFSMGNTKAAFAFSVDGIANRENLAGIEEYIERIHANRFETFQAWSELFTKV